MHVAENFVGYHYVERTPFSAEIDFHTILADSKKIVACRLQNTTHMVAHRGYSTAELLKDLVLL